ncbi:MAG: bacillithiol system redox-active protein YtxJ [Schleiferiaceae bacterium]|jgi:bacillithiol system protein YtxJ|nr:bacillithiol system redox-active protein YtxJ [Schleiferiaceae bacterium]
MLEPHILENNSQLNEIIDLSKNPNKNGVLVFKHSTRCSVSYMAFKGLKSQWSFDGVDFFYLDLIKFREVSNAIEEMFGVKHESPQLLHIKNGKCTNNASHFNVNTDTIENWLNA